MTNVVPPSPREIEKARRKRLLVSTIGAAVGAAAGLVGWLISGAFEWFLAIPGAWGLAYFGSQFGPRIIHWRS